MGAEQNKEIARNYFEQGFNGQNLQILDDILADDIVIHTNVSEEESEIRGRDRVKRLISDNVAGMPDLKFDIQEMIGIGSKVVVRWKGTGTHTGVWRGIAPTGKHASNTGIDIMSFADGKIQEIWNNSDTLGVYQQLGVTPPKSS